MSCCSGPLRLGVPCWDRVASDGASGLGSITIVKRLLTCGTVPLARGFAALDVETSRWPCPASAAGLLLSVVGSC